MSEQQPQKPVPAPFSPAMRSVIFLAMRSAWRRRLGFMRWGIQDSW